MIKPTHANLEKYAAPLIARWLITAAKERRVVTYGEAMEKLVREEGFSSIGRATKLGFPAGKLMDAIHNKLENAPLLNALLVRQDTRLPSAGIGGYLAHHYGIAALGEDGAIDEHPELWSKYSESAIQEAYDFNEWEALFESAFYQQFAVDIVTKKRKVGKDGAEKDGIPRGRHGEGDKHKSLRLWVTQNPKTVAPSLKGVRTETEVELLSGDRVDSVYYANGQTLAIEVKSMTSNWYDLQRGIYQCVKYRAVMRAMDPRENAIVKSLLITEDSLDGTLKALAKQLSVKCMTVSEDRMTIK